MSDLPFPLPVTPSAWNYVTASGGSITLALAAGGGGTITLHSPQRERITLRYGGLGAGLGLGARLPRFGKVNLNVRGKSIGGAGAAEAFPSDGAVYVSSRLAGRDLSRADFTGACLYVEVGGGLAVGGSATAMLFGMDARLLAASLLLNSMPLTQLTLSPMMTRRLLDSASGALLMGGANLGVQAGIGGAAYIGALF